jgi:hypothetical protein
MEEHFNDKNYLRMKNVLSERLNELELAPLKNQELPW